MVIREVNSAIPIVSTVGSRLPMHATGVGKVLPAHSPNDVHDRVMANLVSLGACSLAVPVVQSSGGAVVAAIGVVVATLKCDRQRLLGALQVAARGISRLL